MPPDWLERVKEEKTELQKRLSKLLLFLASPPADIHPYDFMLLQHQSKVMEMYYDILVARICRAEPSHQQGDK